ncbi:MAG: hypothetical protein AAGF24_00005, partial [Cyanobacteria bacterium P01_H01_bin.121]
VIGISENFIRLLEMLSQKQRYDDILEILRYATPEQLTNEQFISSLRVKYSQTFLYVQVGTDQVDHAFRHQDAPDFERDLELNSFSNERCMTPRQWWGLCRVAGLEAFDIRATPIGQAVPYSVTEQMRQELQQAIEKFRESCRLPDGNYRAPSFDTESDDEARYVVLSWLQWWFDYFSQLGHDPVIRLIGAERRGERPIPPYPASMQ